VLASDHRAPWSSYLLTCLLLRHLLFRHVGLFEVLTEGGPVIVSKEGAAVLVRVEAAHTAAIAAPVVLVSLG
jgi:hypothetical protein